MIMNKNNFLKTTSDIIIETRKKCEDVLREYLISVGGSQDVKFKKLSLSEDTYTDESTPVYIEVSRIFIDMSSKKQDICITSEPDGEDWLLAEYMNLDEIIALMYHIAELIDDNAPSV